MKISIVTVFPELYTPFLNTSLVHRARDNGLVDIAVEKLFSYVAPKERIDGPTFGHAAGMVIRPEVVDRAVEDQEAKYGPAYKIFFSPQGTKLDQDLLHELAATMRERKHIMLLPARYEGMDARVEKHYADKEISLGDFVLMGGDLPAMVLLEGMLRLLPGVVGKQESIEQESFSGPFLDHPSFTAPVVWKDKEVPEVIRSGNHAAITVWQHKQAVAKTLLHHFDWMRAHADVKQYTQTIMDSMPHHYAALAHSDIVVDADRIGETSITTIDIHDIARSSATFGLKHFFLYSGLADQHRIAQRLLDFWNDGPGVSYNVSRHKAVRQVTLADSLDDVIARIEKMEGKKPLLIATSARLVDHAKVITYHDQGKVWALDRPVLFIFGTGKGLAQYVVDRCDFLLVPIEGFSSYNHLSVRSAAAIIFDRWLGINKKKVRM